MTNKKVFRIHQGGNIETDWFPSLELGNKVIQTIVDNDEQLEEFPTSIPSPFARIDLVRNAFNYVNNSNLEGKTYHHKLVSDALDIGQILFNYDTFQDNLELISWNKKEQLEILFSSNANDAHKSFAKTLNLFLKQDDQHFNFQLLDDFYILKYDHTVIGGTSPLTLFFAAPFNEKKKKEDQLKIKIQFGQDIMMDDVLMPLYKREPKFIKYLFALSNTNNFAKLFKDLYEYIDKSVKILQNTNHPFFLELHNTNINDYFNDLEKLHVSKNVSETVQVLRGFPLYKLVTDPSKIESDFTIDSLKKLEISGKFLSPLVLPTDRFSFPLKYTAELWDPAKPAPTKDPLPVASRRLPHVNEPYPYLTKGDFLEDTLIKLPYRLNQNGFYTLQNSNYLLPLTNTFFEYFSPATLRTKNLIQIKEHTHSVEIVVNIPITGNREVNSISYNKIYKKQSSVASLGGYSGIGEDEGVIYELELGLAITPPVKGNLPNYDYRVGLINTNPEIPLVLSFYDSEGKPVKPSFENYRSAKNLENSKYFVLNDSFDLIQVQIERGFAKGFLLPIFKEYKASNTRFSFAVDFGTSNTHIEYKTDQVKDSRAFKVDLTDSQVIYSFDPETDKSIDKAKLRVLFTQEIFPQSINDGKNEYDFPMRTAILKNKDVDIQKGTYTFNHYNIAFDFEKKRIQDHLDHITNLKWSNYQDSANRKHLQHYIENILILLRNKVVLNNGDLSQTKIVWFYPSSMGENKINDLRNIWKENVNKVFGHNTSSILNGLPESIAPFYFYNNERNVAAQALPVVSVDIGGGTADIVIYKDDKPSLITSFRFAGNAIFGDGFGGNSKTNGFLIKYLPKFSSQLKANSGNLPQVLDQLVNKGYSEDIINFLFNLATNKELNEKNVSIDLAKALANDEQLKIVFLIYYTSILYHLVYLLKDTNFDKPSKLLFSGTGSKSVFITDQSPNLVNLSLIFDNLYKKIVGENTAHPQTTIQIEDNPKEITAKGGLYFKETDMSNLDSLMTVLPGTKNDQYRSFKPYNTSENEKKLTYKDIEKDPEILEQVVEEVIDFLKVFLELHHEINFQRKFGISQASILFIEDTIARQRFELLNDLKTGLKEKKSELESSDATAMEETMFFYPLIGMLNRLAKSSIQD